MSSITGDGCLIEWTGIKAGHGQSGEISYRVQMTRNREIDAKMVGSPRYLPISGITTPLSVLQTYTGTDLQWRVNGLESKTEYSIKVAAVRTPEEGIELAGSFSPTATFTTLAGAGVAGAADSAVSAEAAGKSSSAAAVKVRLCQSPELST